MQIKIINQELKLNVSGFSGIAHAKDYCGTAFKLMDKMWPIVKSNGLKHNGMNIWVFQPNEMVFAGVELNDLTITDTGLELQTVSLTKYAYHKHIGPYSLIKQAGDHMRDELRAQGLRSTFPYIEIYGHWDNDESKLETELIMAVK